MSDLAQDYLDGLPTLTPFFNGGPEEVFRHSSPTPWDAPFRVALESFQTDLGLARTISQDAPAIVTGQQPGILTGPLYTIYKAITVIRLAEEYEEKTGNACHPVFWVGGDDHDFDEVRTAYILTKNHQDLALTFEPAQDITNLAMYRVKADNSLHQLIDIAAAQAAGSEFRDEIADFLHTSLDESESIADWFALIMARLFRDTSLLIFPTHLPAARVRAAEIFRQEIDAPLTATALLNKAGEALSNLGYAPQVIKGDDECGFYLEVGERRCKVVYRDGAFLLPDTGSRYDRDELLKILDEEPHRFTANVLLRPVVQQALFPAVAYVAGPGEIAYWAQFKEIFAHFEQPMPVVYPRAKAALSTIKLNKLIKKYGLDLDSLSQPQEELTAQALRATVKNPALDLLATERQKLSNAADAFAQSFNQLDGKDRSPATQAASLASQIDAGIQRMEQTLLQSDAAQTEAVRNQIDRLCTTLVPARKPQERHYSIFSWMFEYGWDLIPRLAKHLDIHGFRPTEIEL